MYWLGVAGGGGDLGVGHTRRQLVGHGDAARRVRPVVGGDQSVADGAATDGCRVVHRFGHGQRRGTGLLNDGQGHAGMSVKRYGVVARLGRAYNACQGAQGNWTLGGSDRETLQLIDMQGEES